MPALPPNRNRVLWWLLIPVVAGLVLLAARTVAERRADEAAMSAELLSPFDESVAPPLASAAEPPAQPATGPEVSDSARGTTPAPAGDTGDLRSLVPPELAGALISDTAAPPPPSPPAPLDPAFYSDWTSFADAVAQSRATGRPVMLAFTALRCETCESLREAVFNDVAGSVTLRSAVIPVKVHDTFAESGEEARLVDDLQKRFGVVTFPTLVVWSPATKRMRTLKGYRGAEATLRFITDAAGAMN
jgi:thiol-disulfide isomerase/thioredoxin